MTARARSFVEMYRRDSSMYGSAFFGSSLTAASNSSFARSCSPLDASAYIWPHNDGPITLGSLSRIVWKMARERRNHYDVTDRVRIPMLPGRRSMNLSNAAAVAAYEAWRVLGFAGGV